MEKYFDRIPEGNTRMLWPVTVTICFQNDRLHSPLNMAFNPIGAAARIDYNGLDFRQ